MTFQVHTHSHGSMCVCREIEREGGIGGTKGGVGLRAQRSILKALETRQASKRRNKARPKVWCPKRIGRAGASRSESAQPKENDWIIVTLNREGLSLFPFFFRL